MPRPAASGRRSASIRRLAIVALVLVAGLVPWLPAATAAPDFESSTVGGPADARTEPRGGVALMGGADVDAAFRWLAERADGGEVIVLRASGGGAYNRYIAGLAPVDSVETIVLRHRAGASHPAVLRAIAGAEAVFVAGGDQAVSLEF